MIVQKDCTFRLLGMRTPDDDAAVAIVRPTWALSLVRSLCCPSVTTVTCHLSPPRSSNARAAEGRSSRRTATAIGSWRGGPSANPKTSLYVWAKKTRRSWKRRRSVVGSADVDGGIVDPCRTSCRASLVAKTLCERSSGISVVLAASSALENMACAASGSHCRNISPPCPPSPSHARQSHVDVELRPLGGVPNPLPFSLHTPRRRICESISDRASHDTQPLDVSNDFRECSKQQCNICHSPCSHQPYRPLLFSEQRMPHSQHGIRPGHGLCRRGGKQVRAIKTRIP